MNKIKLNKFNNSANIPVISGKVRHVIMRHEEREHFCLK